MSVSVLRLTEDIERRVDKYQAPPTYSSPSSSGASSSSSSSSAKGVLRARNARKVYIADEEGVMGGCRAQQEAQGEAEEGTGL